MIEDDGPIVPIAILLDANGAPDLQLLVRRCGQRYAASLGEPYEPTRHGGYANITAEEWAAWDRAKAEWQKRRRAGLASPSARKVVRQRNKAASE